MNYYLIDNFYPQCLNSLMRGSAGKLRTDESHYEEDILSKFESNEKRLDLNVLLKRKENEKNLDKKKNIIIFIGALSVASVVFLIVGF